MIEIINIRFTQVKPDIVLNQVIDLIVESDYIKNLQLVEAIFSTDQVKVTIRSEDFSTIQSLSRSYSMENELPYEMYQKGKYSYLNLIFRWKGNDKNGDINILQSMADKIVFSKVASINHTEDNVFMSGFTLALYKYSKILRAKLLTIENISNNNYIIQ